MSRLRRLVNTSIGCKSVMAVTGLVLVLFVIAHMLGNLSIYRGREAMNAYAHMLQSLGPLLWLARLFLLAVFLAHIAVGLKLSKLNREARPQRYEFEAFAQQDPLKKARAQAATQMLLTGLAILLFVLFHLGHFTFGWFGRSHFRSDDKEAVALTEIYEGANFEQADAGTRWEGGENVEGVFVDKQGRFVAAESQGRLLDDKGRPDVYGMFIGGFRNPAFSLSYVVFMLILGAHLFHGMWSMFQTLGVNHRAWDDVLRKTCLAITGLIVLGNCLMPLTVLMGYPGP